MTPERRKQRRRRRRKSDTPKRIQSAVRVAKFALNANLHPDARRRLLNEAIWMTTLAEFSKHKLSLRTRAADDEILRGEPKLGSRVRHEHVYTREWIIAKLEAQPESVEALLKKYAIACVVTVKEARKLDARKHLEGWDRYRDAKLAVFAVQEDGALKAYKP